ncbi:hypothetical protein TRICI_001855 [Trichomonascus ciferrii]|uniref:Uncharacterized protein n=1 Tax=Trichomonascus ciferrii TaxID=44093 RepID=A0A642V7H3_9ASCO|nr:hypothetical protein TRICI_001855 [Trichomonascus ciferrii]
MPRNVGKTQTTRLYIFSLGHKVNRLIERYRVNLLTDSRLIGKVRNSNCAEMTGPYTPPLTPCLNRDSQNGSSNAMDEPGFLPPSKPINELVLSNMFLTPPT